MNDRNGRRLWIFAPLLLRLHQVMPVQCINPAGLAHGPYSRVDATGRRLVTGSFWFGDASGTWQTFYLTGGVQTERNFNHAVPDGIWTTWDQAGKQTSRHQWHNGSLCDAKVQAGR